MKNIKYRIIVRNIKDDDDSYPYRIQRKVGFWSFWQDLDIFSSVEDAENHIPHIHNKYMRTHPKGSVIKTYDSQDLTALILKSDS